MRAAIPIVLLLVAAFAGCLSEGVPKDESQPVRIGNKAKPSGLDVVEPGDYKFDRPFSQVLVPGPYQMKPPVLQLIKSAIDGVDIEIGYWLPDVPEGTKVPVLVHASPYHRPAGSVAVLGGTKRFLHDNFGPHGYAVAAIAVRGTANSGGCMELAGPKEIKDLSQAVTWLATQSWSNGNVGMTGKSYDGSTPWEVAATGNPHLKTIVPISGVNDFYTLMYKNGSAEIRAQVLSFLYYEYGWNVVTVAGGGSDDKRDPAKRVEGALCPEAWVGLGASVYSFMEGGRDPAGFWAARNLRPMVEKNYKGSILNVHGLEDWNVDPSQSLPWVDSTLNMSGIPVHQVLGQWRHDNPDMKGSAEQVGVNYRMDYAEKLLDWFDYWLKDQTTIDLGPAVTVMDNTKRWRVEEHWPPRDANWTTFHLSTSSALRPEEAQRRGIKPLARIVGYDATGIKPELIMEAPIPSVRNLFKKTNSTIDQVDLFEHNEAFATASVAVRGELHVPKEKFNIHGGAVALGHPIGASGTRVLTTLLYALKDRQKTRGVATLCLGGGSAVSMMVERV